MRFDLAIIMLNFEPALLLEQDYYELYSEKVIKPGNTIIRQALRQAFINAFSLGAPIPVINHFNVQIFTFDFGQLGQGE